MPRSNQLTSYEFSDGQFILIQGETAQSQKLVIIITMELNNKMLFHLPPASIQVQSHIDERQKSNSDTMDQVQHQQSVRCSTDIVEQQLRDSYVDNDIENRHNDDSFLSELIPAVQNYSAVWDNTTRSYRDLHKKPVMEKYGITTAM